MIVAPIGESFRLQDLGDARGATQRFLSTTVAPEGSDKQARLLMASERYHSAAILLARILEARTSASRCAHQRCRAGGMKVESSTTHANSRCRAQSSSGTT